MHTKSKGLHKNVPDNYRSGHIGIIGIIGYI